MRGVEDGSKQGEVVMMKVLRVILCGVIALGAAAFGQQPTPVPTPGPVDELVGLWKAKKRFGPDARGPLIIQKDGTTYYADMMGRKVTVRVDKGEFSFALPGNQGRFRGRL